MSAPHPAPQRETPGVIGQLDRNHVLLLVAAIASPLAYLVGITNHALSGLAVSRSSRPASSGCGSCPRRPTRLRRRPAGRLCRARPGPPPGQRGGGLACCWCWPSQTAALVVLLLVEAGVELGRTVAAPQPRQTASPAPRPRLPTGVQRWGGPAVAQPSADAPGFGGRRQPAPAAARPSAPEPPAGAPRGAGPENPPTPSQSAGLARCHTQPQPVTRSLRDRRKAARLLIVESVACSERSDDLGATFGGVPCSTDAGSQAESPAPRAGCWPGSSSRRC